MKMINVLQRLAELDANNPNVVYEGSQKEKSKEEQSVEENNGAHGEETISPVHGEGKKEKTMEDLNLESLRQLAGVKDTIAECGPMGGNTPASINITAGSGQELTGMLKDIMNLAGVHKVEPHHMPLDTPDAGPSTIVSAPPAPGAMVPDMHKLMAIVDGPEMVKDSMNADEETDEGMIGSGLGGLAGGALGKTAGAALGSLVGGPVGGAIGSVAGDVAGTALGSKAGDELTGNDDDDEEAEEGYDNSPDTSIQPDPLSQFGDINSGDHRERQKGLPVAKPVEETFKEIFAAYEKFIAEGQAMQQKGPAEVDVPAYLRKQKRQGQMAAQTAADEKNVKAGAKVWSSKRTQEATGGYSAKDAAAGRDLGEPGKNFEKIAKGAGGGAKGKRIAGAVLKNLRDK